jgi:hypothetical protein
MLLQAQLPKRAEGVDGKNFLRRTIGKQGDRNRDEAADEMRVAVAPVVQDRRAVVVSSHFPLQPNLTDAPPHFVGVIVRLRAQRLKRLAELYHIAIAVLPIVEGGEILADGLDRGQWFSLGSSGRL